MNKSSFLVTALMSLLVLTAFGATGLAQDAGLDPFQAQVDAGELPPLAERLPTTPLVVGPGLLVSLEDQPEWEPGVHGGTLRTAFTSAFGFSGGP